MSQTVIKVDNLSKKYILGNVGYGTLYQTAQTKLAKFFGKEDPNKQIDSHHVHMNEDFWALKNVNLDIKQGDRVGIIGRNGSGKSTLLKILSKVTSPTTGSIKIKGRVASLLEVGTGFHPEMTGRENVFLNGSILGMNKKEINSKLDQIIDFSGVEQFIDTPVKRYSSGMHVRLGFAVAAHLDPDILIVDEILAVGDLEFQKKALGKMEDVSSKDGRTVLFVSHNLASITSLCKSGIVLDKGNIVFIGNAQATVSNYTEIIMNAAKEEINEAGSNANAVRFLSARVFDSNGKTVTSVKISESIFIEMKFLVGNDVKGIPVPNFHFINSDGIYAFAVGAPDMKVLKSGTYTSICKVPGNMLNDGIYSVGLAVTEYGAASFLVHFFEQNFLNFTVIDPIIGNPHRYGYEGPIPGVIRPILEWELKKS